MTTPLIISVAIVLIIIISIWISKKANSSTPNSKLPKKYVSADKINNLLSRASEKGITKDYKSAVAIADKILLLEPDNYGALITRANSIAALNCNLDAIEDYENALKIHNSDGNIYGLLGLTYKKSGILKTPKLI